MRKGDGGGVLVEKSEFFGFWDFSLTPCARVIGLESKCQPAVGGKHSSVPTGRVVVVEVVDVTLLPSLLTGSKDVEVVAVQIYHEVSDVIDRDDYME
jgi:hypothetical protein